MRASWRARPAGESASTRLRRGFAGAGHPFVASSGSARHGASAWSRRRPAYSSEFVGQRASGAGGNSTVGAFASRTGRPLLLHSRRRRSLSSSVARRASGRPCRDAAPRRAHRAGPGAGGHCRRSGRRRRCRRGHDGLLAVRGQRTCFPSRVSTRRPSLFDSLPTLKFKPSLHEPGAFSGGQVKASIHNRG